MFKVFLLSSQREHFGGKKPNSSLWTAQTAILTAVSSGITGRRSSSAREEEEEEEEEGVIQDPGFVAGARTSPPSRGVPVFDVFDPVITKKGLVFLCRRRESRNS